jgi:hypothetical protein
MKSRLSDLAQILVAPIFVLALVLASTTYGNTSRPTAYECEGNACSVVTMTWDQERQQFRVQNDSEQQVNVEVSTFAGTSSVRIAPHKAEYLEVKTFNGPYLANYE